MPKGLPVSLRVSAASAMISSGSLSAQASTPMPPASETAATSFGSEMSGAIAASMTGRSMPSMSHRAVRKRVVAMRVLRCR